MTSRSPDAAWRVATRRGAPAELHAAPPPGGAPRSVWLVEPSSTAVVIGSSQPPPADPDAASVVRRRTGGGAVLVAPGAQLWVEVVITREDPLWDDDVARSFHWLGATWTRALHRLGVPACAHRGPHVPGRWGRVLCFAGLGPGEVTVGGRKLVGLSQRRTAAGAWFQCMVPLVPTDPRLLDAVLGDGPARRAGGTALAAAVATPEVAPRTLLDAFLASLPAAGQPGEGGGTVP